jgi:hypothetical protein
MFYFVSYKFNIYKYSVKHFMFLSFMLCVGNLAMIRKPYFSSSIFNVVGVRTTGRRKCIIIHSLMY